MSSGHWMPPYRQYEDMLILESLVTKDIHWVEFFPSVKHLGGGGRIVNGWNFNFEHILTFKKTQTKKYVVKRQAHFRYMKKTKIYNSLNFILPYDDKGTTRLSLSFLQVCFDIIQNRTIHHSPCQTWSNQRHRKPGCWSLAILVFKKKTPKQLCI